ncbi:type II secretion system protein [Candidatus Dojkabacteria bacterium]|nr:type II secretion system protein [Candidatus Dojkabacteria bacterium]
MNLINKKLKMLRYTQHDKKRNAKREMRNAIRQGSLQAFTLLELLLVIAIIAVLAGIVVFSLRPADVLRNANSVKNVANSKDIKKAIEAYVLDHGGNMPSSLQGQTSGEYTICKQSEVSCPVGSISLDELISGGYLSTIPVNENLAGEKTTGYAIEYDATKGTVEIIAGGAVTVSEYGTGADGAVTIASNKNINTDTIVTGRTCADGINYSVTALTANSATLSSTPAAGCLTANDTVLLINLQGIAANYANVGNYELLTVQTASGTNVTFTGNKTKYYGDGVSDDTNLGTATTNQRVMLQRVPNYTNVTVNNGITLTANGWDGTKGGVLIFNANGTTTVIGIISMNGKGFSESNNIVGLSNPGGSGGGGAGGNAPYDGGGGGGGGGGQGGSFGTVGSFPAKGGGGGGGASWAGSDWCGFAGDGGSGDGIVGTNGAVGSGCLYKAGGGGGSGGVSGSGGIGGTGQSTSGGTGGSNSGGITGGGNGGFTDGGNGNNGNIPGSIYGNGQLNGIYLGSNGGKGGKGGDGTNNANGGTAGTAGSGGGIVLIFTNIFELSGQVSSNGTNGNNGVNGGNGTGTWIDPGSGGGGGGGSGGGSGGSIKLITNSSNIGTNLISSTGGSGGTSGSGGTGTGLSQAGSYGNPVGGSGGGVNGGGGIGAHTTSAYPFNAGAAGGGGGGANGGAGGVGRIAISGTVTGTTNPVYTTL